MANLSAASLLSGDSYAQIATALVISATPSADAAEALTAAGMRIRATTDIAGAPPLLDEPGLDLALLDARGAAEAALAPLVDGLSAGVAPDVPALIVICTPEQIDIAAPLLGMPRARLLCRPGNSELVAAVLLARLDGEAPPCLSVRDVTRDSDVIRLRRLNEEVARIADALARLTRGEFAQEDEIARRGGVCEPEMGYRGPEEPGLEIGAAEIRAVIRARRLRSQYFTSELFADPAWDMLLDLFAASLERRRVSVSSLCIAAAVPPTTALRWIGTMHEAGLFSREADPGDRRRAYIVLSDKAQQGMRGYIGALRRSGLGLA